MSPPRKARGPARPEVAREAAAARVEDLDGKGHRLAELWHDHPVVLVFLRHFG